jgi:hypothetical protein
MKSQATAPGVSGWRALYGGAVWRALLVAAVLAAGVWLASSHKLIYTDEVAFFWDFQRLAAGRWDLAMIPHPPVYTALGGLSVRLFGEGTLALRLPGLLATLASLAIVPLVCWAAARELAVARRAALLAIALLATQPLILQGSLLLDIDNTVMTTAVLAFIAVVGLSERWPAGQQAISVAVAFAVLLWTKLLPLPLLLAVLLLVVFALAGRRLAPLALGLVLGALAFGLSFALFLALSGSSPAVYLSTVGRGGQALRLDLYLSRAVMGGGIQLFWVGMPFFALLLAATLVALRRFLEGRQAPLAAWCSLSVLVGLVVFTLGNELPMGFPRYQVPLVWVGTILTAVWLAEQGWRPLWRFAVPAVGVLLVWFWLVAPDPLEPQYALTFLTDSLAERVRHGLRLAIGTLVVPFALVVLGALVHLGRSSRALVTAALVWSAASWGVISLTQLTAEYSTIYEYGRRGGWEAGARIREATSAGSRIVAPLELVYASGREGRFVYDYLCPTCLASLLDRLTKDPPAAFALSQKEVRRFPELLCHPAVLERLAACYDPPASVGSYVLYLRAERSC